MNDPGTTMNRSNGTRRPSRCMSTWLVAALMSVASVSQAVDVREVQPVRADVVRYITLPASIRANQQATLYAKVAGYLKSIAVDKGDSVKAGQKLGEIEVPELLADRVKYAAEVKVAEVELQRLSVAQKKLADLVMPQTVDEARGRFEIAQANLERTETLLRYSTLTAPFDGIVTARYLDAGAFVPSATSGSAAATAAVVTIVDLQTVRVQVPVVELEASRIARGQPVQVSVEGLPGRVFEGAVSRFSFVLDEATRTMLVEADLPNPNRELRPGMYATARLGVEKHEHALTIPVPALVTDKAGAFVFVVNDGKATKTPIKTGFNDGAKVEVLDGLAGNEAVILVGKLMLSDGAAVNVTEEK